MADLYRIVDWAEIFENNRTKEIKVLAWVPIPTKLDSDGYTELMDHPNGASHYGAWITCVHVAAKSHPRGTLVRSGGIPHDAASLSRISRVPKKVYEEVFPRLVKLGWIEVCDNPAPSCDNPAPSCGAPAPRACVDTELNNTELNGTEQHKGRAPPSVFVPPTLAEVFSYVATRKVKIDPDAFVDFYESKGWMIGKNKMKSWQAAVRTWEKNQDERTHKQRDPRGTFAAGASYLAKRNAGGGDPPVDASSNAAGRSLLPVPIRRDVPGV